MLKKYDRFITSEEEVLGKILYPEVENCHPHRRKMKKADSEKNRRKPGSGSDKVGKSDERGVHEKHVDCREGRWVKREEEREGWAAGDEKGTEANILSKTIKLAQTKPTTIRQSDDYEWIQGKFFSLLY